MAGISHPGPPSALTSRKRNRSVHFTLVSAQPKSRAVSTDFTDRDFSKGRAPDVEVAMKAAAGSERARGAVRCGRPRRELAGMVEERILDAAGKVFLERGFSGASVDEIAEVACAGKPTIYARFPSKEALFTAVIERLVRRQSSHEADSYAGASIADRLEALAAAILSGILDPETIGLIRVAVAEARRFPDLATSVSRIARDRKVEAVSRLLVDFAQSARMTPPAFAPDHVADTAFRFLSLTVLPMLVRALFGEDLAALRAEIAPHAARTVAFFLAACGYEQATA